MAGRGFVSFVARSEAGTFAGMNDNTTTTPDGSISIYPKAVFDAYANHQALLAYVRRMRQCSARNLPSTKAMLETGINPADDAAEILGVLEKFFSIRAT